MASRWSEPSIVRCSIDKEMVTATSVGTDRPREATEYNPCGTQCRSHSLSQVAEHDDRDMHARAMQPPGTIIRKFWNRLSGRVQRAVVFVTKMMMVMTLKKMMTVMNTEFERHQLATICGRDKMFFKEWLMVVLVCLVAKLGSLPLFERSSEIRLPSKSSVRPHALMT